jgi:hypothetical protein
MLVMFYTYRSFSTGSQELLALLIARERATTSREIKIRYHDDDDDDDDDVVVVVFVVVVVVVVSFYCSGL